MTNICTLIPGISFFHALDGLLDKFSAQAEKTMQRVYRLLMHMHEQIEQSYNDVYNGASCSVNVLVSSCCNGLSLTVVELHCCVAITDSVCKCRLRMLISYC